MDSPYFINGITNILKYRKKRKHLEQKSPNLPDIFPLVGKMCIFD